MATEWYGLKGLLTQPGPFAPPFFEAGEDNLETLTTICRVLVVGAGGLGCELLKDLAMSGFRNIDVIDLDTIDLSNLNRQLLFRKKHIGQPKAKVAAEVIMAKYPKMKVNWHVKPIQEFSPSWYKQFHIVIAGLDNVEARRWLNSTLNQLVQYDEEGDPIFDSSIPLLDGGTEGFRGQTRLFFPKMSSCFECSMATMPQDNHFHLCTIANVPRIPEHCIQYVYEIMWPLLTEFKGPDDYTLYEKKSEEDSFVPKAIKLNKDDPQHMEWIFKRSLERAEKYKISGVTYKLTMQVVKNIIPAIASTNAIISASCVLEAVKVITRSSYFLNNWNFYNGVQMTGCDLTQGAKLPNCPVCSPPAVFVVDKSFTVQQLRSKLESEHELENPDLSCDAAIIYLTQSADSFAANLAKPVSDFVQSQEHIRATSTGRKNVDVVIVFTE